MLRTVSIVASLVILLLSSDSAAQVTEKTDTGWIALNSSGYHLSLEPMNWSTAQTHCHEKGARLLSLPSNTEVSKLLAEIELYTKQRSWWLGVRRNSSVSSTWVSLNETSPFYGLITLWNKDQPDNWKDKEGCAMMQPSGLLNDLPCAKRLKFICERHLMIAHNASSMECGHGWIFIPPSCYKFSINAASWSEAQNECRENKGNLLTVNSLEELLQIKKAMFRANKEACWWIGIWKISTNNSWAWLEGPPHLASLVIQWKKSEPNNVLGKEDCVMMDSDGLLSDVPCDSSRYFICSRDANKIKDCGGGWTLIHHACYRMSTRTAAWPDAQKECQTEGGSLLTVKTVYELMEILTEAKRVSSRWLVDVRRISRDRSTWEWLDSTTVFSSLAIPWDKNKPSSPASNRDCAEMDYSGLLNDAPCYSLLPYICEKPLMDHSKTCDFMWDLLNGICYVHFTRAMSWSDAQESCQKSGSNLLSINSLDERKWVLRMLKAKARRWWVGLQRTSPSYNAWKWLDSVTDFSSHVTPWGKNEPNDMGGDENCAEISPRGLLNDESCSESFGFICEKSSNTTSENRAEECGMDWILFNNACYKLSTNQMTWSQAQKKCQEGGANLLSINSLDELNMIQSEIRKVSERWWIGLKRTPGYETRSFVPPTNLPSPVMTESDCVEMTPGGFLSYINCSDIRQFICENQKGPEEEASSTTKPSDTAVIAGAAVAGAAVVGLSASSSLLFWKKRKRQRLLAEQEKHRNEGGSFRPLHEPEEEETYVDIEDVADEPAVGEEYGYSEIDDGTGRGRRHKPPLPQRDAQRTGIEDPYDQAISSSEDVRPGTSRGSKKTTKKVSLNLHGTEIPYGVCKDTEQQQSSSETSSEDSPASSSPSSKGNESESYTYPGSQHGKKEDYLTPAPSSPGAEQTGSRSLATAAVRNADDYLTPTSADSKGRTQVVTAEVTRADDYLTPTSDTGGGAMTVAADGVRRADDYLTPTSNTSTEGRQAVTTPDYYLTPISGDTVEGSLANDYFTPATEKSGEGSTTPGVADDKQAHIYTPLLPQPQFVLSEEMKKAGYLTPVHIPTTPDTQETDSTISDRKKAGYLTPVEVPGSPELGSKSQERSAPSQDIKKPQDYLTPVSSSSSSSVAAPAKKKKEKSSMIPLAEFWSSKRLSSQRKSPPSSEGETEATHTYEKMGNVKYTEPGNDPAYTKIGEVPVTVSTDPDSYQNC